MLNGLYAAAAGLQAQQDRLDALANDVANVNTTGYKRSRLSFRDLVYQGTGAIRRGSGAAIDPDGRSWRQGGLQETGSPLSVALDGPGFFQVRRGDGTVALTRDGNFTVDASGALVTGGGERLEPAITFPAGTQPEDVSIGPDGTVTVGATAVGTIQVVDVPARAGLEAVGDTLFLPTTASGQPAAKATTMRQGYLEAANVDIGEAMVGVLEAQRATEMVSRALRTQDTLLDIANGIRR